MTNLETTSGFDRSDGRGTEASDAFLLLLRPPWMARAACRGSSVDKFFPSQGEDTRPARQVCSECPVRADCASYALANGERFGIWGGTTERERRTIRRTQPRPTPDRKPAAPVEWRRTAEGRALLSQRRELIVLLYVDGMLPAEIAAVACISRGHVENAVSSADVPRQRALAVEDRP